MNTASPQEITPLLLDWSNGDQEALKKLIPLVEMELRRRAKSYMRRERPGHLLQTSALVNEVYLRLVDARKVDWKNRAHFFAIAAQIMRHILVDYARKLPRVDGQREAKLVELEEAVAISTPQSPDLLDLIALDDALKLFAMVDPLKCRIVELRYFGEMTMEEVAEALKLPLWKIKKEWKSAKAWLYRELSKQ